MHQIMMMNKEEDVTHHRSVHIPECSFLAVEDLPLYFVSFLVHSEDKGWTFCIIEIQRETRTSDLAIY